MKKIIEYLNGKLALNKSVEQVFFGALMGSFFGTIAASGWIKTTEDFKKACETLDKKSKEYKPFEQMTIEQLKQVLQKSVSEENYKKATEIKKLIDYRGVGQK